MADKVGNLAIIISGNSSQFMQVMAGVEQAVAAGSARIEAKQAQQSVSMGKSLSFVGGLAKAAAVGMLGREMMKVGDEAINLSRDFELAEVQLEFSTPPAQMEAGAALVDFLEVAEPGA